jgi:TetR/AcrR family transcriptional regulator, regulator of cefoperazone and chloramphenicol sensitivity
LKPRGPRKADAGPAATGERLLEAAGAVFAEHGYRDTTVRAICRRAGVNGAAVNYHFGDKEQLYLEVLRHAHRRALERHPTGRGLPPDAAPAARLRSFVRSFLLRLFEPGPTSWMGRLMAMEMINPSVALGMLVEERIEPMARELAGIVAALLGPAADPEVVRLSGSSIVSQCVFYAHCRSVIQKLFPQQGFAPADVEKLAEHITEFSLAALQAQARARRGRRRSARRPTGRSARDRAGRSNPLAPARAGRL